jgi:phthiocerol/phenolphthiocerol synthesis type-I polyketide synthase E
MSAHTAVGVAIIGLSCRFPGASNLDELLHMLGEDSTPKQSHVEPPRPGAGAKSDQFEASLLELSATATGPVDPRKGALLVLAQEALENAGYDPHQSRARIGVFIGAAVDAPLLKAAERTSPRVESDQDSLSAWISSKLALDGPHSTVETSSPFTTALHCALESLKLGETELALAGSVSLAASDGSGSASSGGMVVLKRMARALSDGDSVHAVVTDVSVAGMAARRSSFAAPSVPTPHDTSVQITAHTEALGELEAAQETAALFKAILLLNRGRPIPDNHQIMASAEFENAGTLRTNSQPPDEVSEERRCTRVIFGSPGSTSAYVTLEVAPLTDWSPGAEAAHLLILSARTECALDQATHRLRTFLVANGSANLSNVAYTLQVGRRAFAHRRTLVCADREDAIAALAEQNSKRVLSRRADGARRPIVFLLPGFGDQYLGMGHDLYETWPVFRREVDRCAEILAPHIGIDIRKILYPPHRRWKKVGQTKGVDLKRMLDHKTDEPGDSDSNTINRTLLGHPALFTVEYAAARLWQSLGITPDAIVGHSMGEYVAACLAGVFSLEDALRLIAVRAKLVSELPEGAMLAVMMPEGELRPLLPSNVFICLINSPNLCVIAGAADAVEEFEKLLTEREIISRPVRNGHAFHSRMLDPIVTAYVAEVSRIQLRAPLIPYISNVTGDWITSEEATDPAYWGRHVNHTARFSDALHHMWQLGNPVQIECGPGRTLSVLATQHPARKGAAPSAIWSLRQGYETEADDKVFLSAVGKVWLAGHTVQWESLPSTGRRRRVPLPTYPFQSEHLPVDNASDTPTQPPTTTTLDSASPPAVSGHRVEIAEGSPDTPASGAFVAPRNELETTLAKAYEDVLEVSRIGVHDDFLELGGHSLSAIKLISAIKRDTGLNIKLHDVFRFPTIARLASSLSDGGMRNDSPVIPLQPKGEGVPLFCLLGVSIYREFAQKLGADQPVFAVCIEEEQAIIEAVQSGNVPSISIERLAESYYRDIRRHRPQGPYKLAGLSAGGILALELACQMRARGEQVEVVLMFDTYLYSMLPNFKRRKWLKWFYLQIMELATGHGRERLQRLLSLIQTRLKVLKNQPQNDQPPAVPLVIVPTAEAEKRWHAERATRLGVDFPVVLFRATERRYGPDFDIPEDLGWTTYLGERLSVVFVTGGHTSMLEPPNVAELSRQARRFLRNSGSEPGVPPIVAAAGDREYSVA